MKLYALIRSTNGNIGDHTSFNCAFSFFCGFSQKTVQILMFKIKYLENGLADFNDFGLILQEFGRLLK